VPRNGDLSALLIYGDGGHELAVRSEIVSQLES
jgi:hypothetical protein